ncbi:hypothetical protein GH714_023601 [Hevea brasiliensis]|uniref:DNA mismatch repair protein S5 domain-containing protein n=1 Tax=Hevea brasiliensis TaxID=3981 RepID=A0A6A6LEN4_HEVBR|nr:hypothetical protein GH714_023601 [Hevea brasiliensis]
MLRSSEQRFDGSILDLSSSVKELVENSLDAGATSIEIFLKEYGEEWFQVIDNGCGISPNNFKVLALKHHTSKLANFPDLQSLATFGFRGEALSSLCALGDLTVETRTKNESVATHLIFDHSGLLTTVTVKKFSNLPVRSKEFSRNIRKEYGKLISLLNAYALIAKGVRSPIALSYIRHVRSLLHCQNSHLQLAMTKEIHIEESKVDSSNFEIKSHPLDVGENDEKDTSTIEKFVNKRKHEDISIALSEIPILRNQTVQSPLKKCYSEVNGQFNLGFIIGKLDQDLFIVDQVLDLSLRLELSPEEEVVASMNMDVIRKNGFALEEDTHATYWALI